VKKTAALQREICLEPSGELLAGRFEAMASPCVVLLETTDTALARQLATLAAGEAWRIEQKFSRYREDGIIPAINRSHGKPVEVDDETATLLDFAFECFLLSNGLFDITSGVLRRVWKFDGKHQVPPQQEIDKLLPLIGLQKTVWQRPFFTLPPGMEIDVGGIGKEYAADRILQILRTAADIPVLVNLGGDIAASPRITGKMWRVGIEDIHQHDKASRLIDFPEGGLATSGDARRVIVQGKRRYSHILNPKTGWPVANAPRSVTVCAASCTQAGILSTLAMLQGRDAGKFLQNEKVTHWIQR
jgi:thiamine biosynthesis lipoprotein